MKCLQKYWNNAIDVYSCCYKSFVIYVHIMFLLLFTNLHFIFSIAKWSPSWRERRSGKKISTKCIKEFISIFISSFHFKSWCWVFLSNLWIKSSYQVLHQVFVSSLPIKSLYQVFMSSLHIKSFHQVFLSSLFIKSSYQVFVWGHSQTMFTARVGGSRNAANLSTMPSKNVNQGRWVVRSKNGESL